MKSKVTSARHAIERIRPRDTVCTSGFVGTGTPEELIKALEKRYLKTRAPFDLSLVFAAAPGDGDSQGVNRLAHPGMIKRIIGGHWALVPKLGELAVNGDVEAYNLPLGVMSELFREIAGRRLGVMTRIGLGTFVDPRQDGGRLNERTWEPLVELMNVSNEEWLLYKSFPIDVAFIRGTTADENGNITLENEALRLDNLAIAQAARNSGGIVIAQVERVVPNGTLSARDVEVPGIFVDHVVVARPENHRQTWATDFDPAYAGQQRVPLDALEPMRLDARKIIARRAALELPEDGIINLGIGMPEGVSNVAAEEGIIGNFTLTAEPGIIGGMPQSGLNFGAAVNHQALLQQNEQFDFYDGGGLDLAILGMAQVDVHGHVNVSKFGKRLAGAGGFINISQTAKRLIFVGTFSTGGLDVSVDDGTLTVIREGSMSKFIKDVEQITFNATRAADSGRPVLYITERCVFELSRRGLKLIEVAPGIDIERDILGLLPFPVWVANPKTMDARLFVDKPMGLARNDDVVPLPTRTAAAPEFDRVVGA